MIRAVEMHPSRYENVEKNKGVADNPFSVKISWYDSNNASRQHYTFRDNGVCDLIRIGRSIIQIKDGNQIGCSCSLALDN